MLKRTGMAPGTPPRRERGAAAVEFALIAIVFFTLLLGIIEFGRLLYLWNTVQEVTRKAAREAVVRWADNVNVQAIQMEAIFRGGTTGEVSLPGGGEVTYLRVIIRHLNASMAAISLNQLPADPADNVAACLDAARAASCISFVEAKVCEGSACSPVKYVPMIGLFPFLAINIPASTVVMPAESMGFR